MLASRASLPAPEGQERLENGVLRFVAWNKTHEFGVESTTYSASERLPRTGNEL